MTEKKLDSISIVERKDSYAGLGCAERKNINERLADSERKYRLAFEAAASIITLVDSEGIIQECNFRVEELTGYSVSELEGKG